MIQSGFVPFSIVSGHFREGGLALFLLFLEVFVSLLLSLIFP